MNKLIKRIVPVITVGLLWANLAHADWALFGIATRCDSTGKGLSLAPVVELSESDPGAVPVAPGFRQLAYGEHKIRCVVAGAEVSVTIHVSGPGQGYCMGAGYVSIEDVAVGRAKVVDIPQSFNWGWGCDSQQPMVTRVNIISRGSQLLVETCQAKDWNWGVGYSGNKCETQPLRHFNASFNCNKATSRVEKLICASEHLSGLDRTLAEAYTTVAAHSRDFSAVQARQREWLRSTRNACSDAACLDAAYTKRIKELNDAFPNKPTPQ
jgi:uncharacterized protein YecT (DUF1311 family)